LTAEVKILIQTAKNVVDTEIVVVVVIIAAECWFSYDYIENLHISILMNCYQQIVIIIILTWIYLLHTDLIFIIFSLL
jgi:hypothetical protein